MVLLWILKVFCSLIRHYTYSGPCYQTGPCYRSWHFMPNSERFNSIEHLQRVWYPNRGRFTSCLIPPGTYMFSNVETSISNTFHVSRISNIPGYFCFTFVTDFCYRLCVLSYLSVLYNKTFNASWVPCLFKI